MLGTRIVIYIRYRYPIWFAITMFTCISDLTDGRAPWLRGGARVEQIYNFCPFWRLSRTNTIADGNKIVAVFQESKRRDGTRERPSKTENSHNCLATACECRSFGRLYLYRKAGFSISCFSICCLTRFLCSNGLVIILFFSFHINVIKENEPHKITTQRV